MPNLDQMVMKPETIRVVLGSALTTSYQNLGTPLVHPSVIYKVVNLSNQDVLISVGDSTDEDICPAGGFYLYDEVANAVADAQYKTPAGTQFQVKSPGGAGSQAKVTSNVYLVTYYAT